MQRVRCSDGQRPARCRGAAPAAHPLLQTDLAAEQQLLDIESEIRAVNAEARINRCQRCAIDLRLILNTGMYSAGLRGAAAVAAADGSSAAGAEGGAAAAAGGAEQQQQAQQQAEGAEHACGPQCSNPAHHHHHGSKDDPNKVGTVTINLPPGQPLDLARLRHWLDTLLWEDGTADAADLFRIKGLLCVAGSTHKHVLQVGGRRGECSAGWGWEMRHS